MKKEYDAIGFDNTLVDYTAYVDEAFLKEFNLRKGDWRGIKDKAQEKIEANLEGKIIKTLGGSASNTIAGMNNLSSKVAYFGSAGDDGNGKLYEEVMGNEGVKMCLKRKKGRTGVAITVITPDGERSFAVNMGVSGKLKVKEVPKKLIKKSKIFHTSGYALEQSPDAILYAAKYAKKKGTKVSVDLGSVASVNNSRDKLLQLLSYSDIIFANEEEAMALTGKGPEEALEELAKTVDIAIVKLGKKGAVVKSKNNYFRMHGFEVEVVNTNGAGDGFAAGFLNSFCIRPSIIRAALVGSLYAAKIVQEEGARLKGEKQEEKEIKIALPSMQPFNDLRNCLYANGAVYDDSSFEINRLYHIADFREHEEIVRVRQDSKGFRLTFKGKRESEKGVKKVQEVELKVKDLESTLLALKNSGFVETGHYEKYRETYAYNDAKIMLDHICNNYFVEIEAKDENLILSLVRKFNLANFKVEERTYATMFGYKN